MKARLMARFATLMLLLHIGGCASIEGHWPWSKPLPLSPVPAAKITPLESMPPTAIEQPAERRRRSHRTRSKAKAATVSVPAETQPAATGIANVAPATANSVTLEDNDADHSRAQALCDDADARLAQIDRSKLTGENATAYDQASDLANAAHKAMTQHDYLAASGLARKAALVTAQVASRTSSR